MLFNITAKPHLLSTLYYLMEKAILGGGLDILVKQEKMSQKRNPY